MPKKPKFTVEVLPGSVSGWYWRIKASNGKTLCHSEVYTTKRMAIKTAEKMAENIGAEFIVK